MPVIVMTSSSHPSDRKRALDLGVTAYMVKPIGFTELVANAKEVREYADKFCAIPNAGRKFKDSLTFDGFVRGFVK